MGNIFCIGRNYAEHAKELGNSIPATPVVFLKPSGSLIEAEYMRWQIPAGAGRLDPEVELVLKIGKDAAFLTEKTALEAVSGFAVGLDFTARDAQTEAKTKGLPWLLSKGQKGFGPVSSVLPLSKTGAGPFDLELKINGEVRQKASTTEMIFSLEKILCYLAEKFGLFEGDLVFTGTPAGVGPIKRGDKVEARLSTPGGEARLSLDIA